MSEIATRNPSAELVEWAASEERVQQYAMALPDDINPDAFARALKTALVSKPELLKADRASLYLALLNSAQLGLVPDGRQAAIVVYGDKAQLIPMIGGVRDILAKYGWMLQTSVVYEADEFAFDEARQLVTHRPPRVGSPRGEIQGAYAQATHRDGRRMAEVMSLAEIHLVRDKSKRANPAWADKQSYPRMVEKTPGHRLAKKLPLDPKDRERLDRVLVDDLQDGEAAAILYPSESSAPPFAGVEDSAAQPAQEAAEALPSEAAASPTPGAAASPPLDEPGPSGEQEAALEAAKFVPPVGKFSSSGQQGPKTIGEIMELGQEGAKWLAWALEAPTVSGIAAYEAAVLAYARVFAPALYQEALAKRELAS